jgi:hypothetical protein
VATDDRRALCRHLFYVAAPSLTFLAITVPWAVVDRIRYARNPRWNL